MGTSGWLEGSARLTVEGELGCNGCAMRKALATIAAILIVLGASSPSWAGYDEGVAAAKRGDYATALREFWALAQRDDAEGQNGLGVMYIKGWGVAKDDAQAVRWWRKSAEQGNAKAQHSLGGMYFRGTGVSKDYAEAARWWRKAAEQGVTEVQINLGLMYANGQGVPQDQVQAFKWYNVAVSRSPPGRQYDSVIKNRDDLVKIMTVAQVSEALRLAREWMAKFEARSKKP